MCKVYKRIGAVFCTFGIILMFIAGLMFNTSAADATRGSLTLICTHENFALSGMNWQIYEVGEKRGNGYSLTGNFASYPIDLSKVMESTESMTEAASTLSNFAVLDNIPSAAMGRTDKDGMLKFSNLENGLYLAVGSRLKVGSETYFPTPFLIEINGSDITSYPKFIVKYTLPGERDRFTLRKIWANATIVKDIPESLTIEIYQDGELFDTVTISAETDWTYSWDGDKSSEWRVKETSVPAGCFVMYRNNEVQFVIMNSYDSDLLARTTTTTSVTTTTETTVVSTDTTTRPGLIDIGSGTVTTVTSTVTKVVQPADSTVATTKNSLIDFGSATKTTATSVIPTDVKPAESSVSGTVTTVTDESTGTETYPTDTNGSTITTSATTPKSDSEVKSTKSSKSTVTTTTIEKLPQTGQLWWPVPVMLFGGVIFVAIGLKLLLDNRKED